MTVPFTVEPAAHASQTEAHNSMHFFLTDYVDERCFTYFLAIFYGLIIFNFYQCSVVKQDQFITYLLSDALIGASNVL